MKAVRIHAHGDTDVLNWEDAPNSQCSPNSVKVKIHAASLNHLDIWVRNGLPGIPIPLPLTMGSDAAGIVVEIGKSVDSYVIGDEVVIQPGTFCGICFKCENGQENYCSHYGILGETENGVQAEYIVVDPINLHPKSPHLSFESAASMPLVFMTAYQMLVKRAKLQPHETVLIYGATSGVGSAAIQIAKDIGATVITTVGSTDKFEHAEKMSADHVINHHDENWVSQVKEITRRFGINVIFEHVGEATWSKSMRLLSKGGRVVTCGSTTGPIVNIDLRHLFMKQQTVLGSTMSDIDAFQLVMKKIDSQSYQPFVDTVFEMSDIRSAHQRMEDRQQFGKIVLVP